MDELPLFIRVMHEVPGRVRFRLPWLHRVPEQATPLAERLAAIEGMREVAVRARTGSVLCVFDPEQLDRARIHEVLKSTTGAERVLGREERALEVGQVIAPLDGAPVARATVRAFRELNADVIAAFGGRIDLPSLAVLGFLVAGASEVVATRKLPMPPWFNLSWWAFRMFMTLEKDALLAEREDRPGVDTGTR
jgi:hypothetical protein